MNFISDAFNQAISHELANLRTFDGSWLEQSGEEICRITEDEAHFGTEVSVTTSITNNKISLAVPGERQQRQHGALDVTGLRLLWPSGEVWHRNVSPAVALAINCKFGSQEIQPLHVADVLVAITSADRWPPQRAEAESTTDIEDEDVLGNNSDTVGFDSDDDHAVNLALALCKDQGIDAEIRFQFGNKIYGTVCVMLAVVNIITVACWLARVQITSLIENYPKAMNNVANHCLYIVFMGVFFRISIVAPFFSLASKEGSLASMKTASTISASLFAYSIAIGCLIAWVAAKHEARAGILRQAPTAMICVILPLWATFLARGQNAFGPRATIAVAACASLLCTALFGFGPFATAIGATYGCAVALVIDNIVSAPDRMMTFVLGRLESMIDLWAVVAWDVFHGCLPYAMTTISRGCTPSISSSRSDAR